MSVHSWWAAYIRQGARARGLDPAAVLAVASAEGLSGRVGDGGHAFGPFQMNDAGGVLTNRPGNHRAFAESRAGIDAALDAMVPLAKGLKGRAAIASIVKRYERPAAPDAEIERAMGSYGHVAGGAAPGPVAPRPPRIPSIGTGPVAPRPPRIPSIGTGFVAPDAAETAAQGASSLRAQAMQGFSDIAAGGSPTTEFGQMASFIHDAKANPTVPRIHPETMAAAQANPNGLEAQAVKLARNYLGVKYTWGGTTAKGGFDCSGLIQTVWKSLGKNIPRTTFAQWDAGTPVAANKLRPGDAVYFTGPDPMNGKPGHVGMYLGNGKFIEAAHTGTNVRVSSMAGRNDYVGARRFA